MVRLGGAASPTYITVFQGLQTHFEKQGIDLEWVLYSDWDALVDGFVNKEIDLAWYGPLAYVKSKKRLNDPGKILAMRDFDVNFTTKFITQTGSDILTVEDLKGKRFAMASRGSVQAGLLAHYFLKQAGINPSRDLAAFTFYEERQPSSHSDEKDVVERVASGEYDAGAVCGRTLEVLEKNGELKPGSVRVFYSPPGYSHCCFAAQSEMEQEVAQKLTEAFLSIDDTSPEGIAVLEGEHCDAFVPGAVEGWESLERAAEEEGII